MKQYCYYQAPIGNLLLVEENGKLEQLMFPVQHQNKQRDSGWEKNRTPFLEVIKQLDTYFAGKSTSFSLDLSPAGTAFQRQVWQELSKIPYGETIHYGLLAEKIGNPKASRAVGMANGKNPIPIIIPCHRVIGKNGSLTGFGGGLEIKKQLLQLEGVNV